MTHPSRNSTASALKVFLSYSRKDSRICSAIASELSARGYVAIYDQSDSTPDNDPDLRLSAQDEWWKQIKTMIAASDVMVFLVSPDSAASPVCDDEIAYARSLGKRLIAIKCRDIDINSAPERLRSLNIKIDFSGSSTAVSQNSLEALALELDVDIEWHRLGAHYTRLAHYWDASGRSEGHLLRANAVSNADEWAARRPRTAEEPGSLVLAFLEASRNKEDEDRRRLLTITGRAFVPPAEQALQQRQFDVTLRYLAASAILGDDLEMELVREREAPLRRGVWENRLLVAAHDENLRSAALSGDGKLLVTASGADNAARIWDAGDGALLATLRGHESFLHTAIFSPDGKAVVTASDDGTARLWDASNGNEIGQFRGHETNVLTAEFAKGGRILVTTGTDNTVRIWDVSTRQPLHVLHVLRGQYDSGRACLSPDGAVVVTWPWLSAAAEPLRFWSTASGSEVRTIDTDHDVLHEIAFSPDGRTLLAAARSLRLWDMRTGREMASPPLDTDYVVSAAFSPDGKRIAAASEGFVTVIDLAT